MAALKRPRAAGGAEDGRAERVTEEALAFLALQRVPGLGPAGIRALVDRLGSGRAALRFARSAPVRDLAAATGGHLRIGSGTLAALRALSPERERPVLDDARARGLRFHPYGSREYPAALYDLASPPPLVFAQGRAWPAPGRTVAIVGTRRATRYGRRVAYTLAWDLARRGWSVASGMATGIDAHAHAGALDGGGLSLGILGSGHAFEYPASNRSLYARMRAGGLLASEFEPRVRPDRATFPRRNRIIAALASGVVVVEAGAKSGALITADHALELGREVMAVPGRVGDPVAEGTLGLLRQGAAAVGGVRDVLDALGWVSDGEETPPPPVPIPGVPGGAGRDGEEPPLSPGSPPDRILRAIRSGAAAADELAGRLGLSVPEVRAALTRLELDGRVARVAGGAFEATGAEATGAGTVRR